jgi:glycosyltransferase involved in cell wall biosynthesis
MKILQLIYESFNSPYGFGGAGVRAYEIYKRLAERHDITLLCMKYPGAKDGDIHGLKHVFAGTESKSLIKSVLAYTVKAALYVKKHGDNFDIIVENFLPSTPFFSPLMTKTPVILQVQGVMYKHVFEKFNPFLSTPMYLVEKFYPRLFDKFIFVSEVTKNKVMAGMRRHVKVCPVIPNGIDKNLLDINSVEDDYILFFSRIDSYTKGIDLLISAFERLAPEYPHLKLVLAGYEFDKIEAVLSGCPPSLRGKVAYAGFVTGEEKVRLLSRAKLFVLPSRHESSPISIIEAAACGKAVVVSDIPELQFVEENGFGVSFPSGSAGGLQEKIALLLEHGGMRRELGLNGRIYAKNYLWDTIALEYENVISSLNLV